MATTIDPTEFMIERHIGDIDLFAEYRWHVDHDEPEIVSVCLRGDPTNLLPIVNDRVMFDLAERCKRDWAERNPK